MLRRLAPSPEGEGWGEGDLSALEVILFPALLALGHRVSKEKGSRLRNRRNRHPQTRHARRQLGERADWRAIT
jgi:hypothetical protein